MRADNESSRPEFRTRFGAWTIARIAEIQGPGMRPEDLYPDWRQDRHGAALAALREGCVDRATGRFVSSLHGWLVRSPALTVLVDTGAGNGKARPHHPRYDNLRTPYLERLMQAGVSPDDIDVVILTHLHVDHVGWNTLWDGREWSPTFRNARYLAPARDLADWRGREAKGSFGPDEAAVWTDSIEPLLRSGQLEPIAPDLAVAPELRVESAPGHTIGHQVACLSTTDGEALFVGDLVHQPVQVAHPDLNTCFCESPSLARASRWQLLDRAATRRSWLFPVHFAAPLAFQVERAATAFRIASD